MRRKQAKTSVRGYGGHHQRLRKQWARKVAAGGVLCARCHREILPDEPWELDHDDEDSTGKSYLGASHRRCNRATAAHRAAKRRQQMIQRWSRKW